MIYDPKPIRVGQFMLDRHYPEDGWVMVNLRGEYYKSFEAAKKAALNIVGINPDSRLRIRDYWGGVVWDHPPKGEWK